MSSHRGDPVAEPSAIEGGETIRRNAVLAFLAQLSGALFTAGLVLFLARRLGTGGFGLFSLALGIAGLVLTPSDFGVSTSTARFVAEHRGDRSRVEAVLADALRLKLLASATVAGLLFALARPIASVYGIHALAWPIRGVAIALFGQSLMMMTSVFVALARVRYQLWTAIVESTVETTATVTLVLAGAGVTGAAFGRGIGYLAGGAMAIFALVRLLGPEILPRRVRFGADARRIATYAGVVLVIDGAFTLFNQVDILIIGAFLSTSAVGIFSAPLRLVSLLGYPGGAISSGVSPLLARGPGQEPNVRAFLTSLRVLLILQTAITAIVLGWATPIVELALGGGYGKSAVVLQALAPFVFLLGFGPLVSGAANYLGVARRRVPIAVAAVIVNLVLDLVLVPSIGVVGGAIGTDAAYALYAPAHLLVCQRVLRFDLLPAARTLVRTLVAGGAMTAVLLEIGGSLGEAWRLPLGGLAGGTAFALLLWATGEVSGHEARALLSQLPRARHKRRKRAPGEDRLTTVEGRPAAVPADPADREFYEHAYSHDGERALLYGRWRTLSAVGKAGHVISLCERANLNPASTLDVGCGDGAVLSALSARGFGGRLRGVEIAPAAIAIARRRSEIAAVARFDGARLPYPDDAHDLGILSHVLEHVSDPQALLAEVARTCRAVVVEVPLERNLSARRADRRERAAEVGHLHSLDRRAVRGIVAGAGLSIAGELEDPLPVGVHRFFATSRRARARATAKWAVRAIIHALAPPLARRMFTVHYACLCVDPADLLEPPAE